MKKMLQKRNLSESLLKDLMFNRAEKKITHSYVMMRIEHKGMSLRVHPRGHKHTV